MRGLIVCITLLMSWSCMWAQPQVPASMNYCGINLTFTEGARSFIQSEVNRYRSSPTYFDRMAERAALYFPFIEEAFGDEGVPEDLKFLSIQESAMKPHAVSTSNAVGFWQFKKETAQEMGLEVSAAVDERKHIYRSTRAAARYFAKANADFNNWLYAIISYYQGPTGAVPYTDPLYYGKTFMVIEPDFHPYALKAIAHKIAYEDAIQKKGNPPTVYMPFATKNERNWREVIQFHQTSPEAFLDANPWLNRLGAISTSSPFTYYIPVPASRFTQHVEDPTKRMPETVAVQEFPPMPTEVESPLPSATAQKEEPPRRPEPADEPDEPSYFLDEAQPLDKLDEESYVLFRMEDDLHYGRYYTRFFPEQGIEPLAERTRVTPKSLLKWNQVTREADLAKRQLIYLTSPRDAAFYIVEEGDRIPDIAERFQISLGKLLKKNRMDEWDMTVYVGQKLYLKKKKPKSEKLILLHHEEPQVFVNYEEQENSRSKPTTSPQPTSSPPSSPSIEPSLPPSREIETKWLTHTVVSGESLWSISRKYGTKVEIIKRINGMDTDELAVGRELRIMKNESKDK